MAVAPGENRAAGGREPGMRLTRTGHPGEHDAADDEPERGDAAGGNRVVLDEDAERDRAGGAYPGEDGVGGPDRDRVHRTRYEVDGGRAEQQAGQCRYRLREVACRP